MMEINAVLDKHGLAKAGLWYVLSPENEGPCGRVGHTCCVLKTSRNMFLKDEPVVDSENNESLLIIGGANPDGAFDDVYALDFGEICDLVLVMRITVAGIRSRDTLAPPGHHQMEIHLVD